jgi:hypothetical protein
MVLASSSPSPCRLSVINALTGLDRTSIWLPVQNTKRVNSSTWVLLRRTRLGLKLEQVARPISSVDPYTLNTFQFKYLSFKI